MSSDHPEDPFSALVSEKTTVLPPDYVLKKMIGENIDIKQVFSEETVAKAQNAIDKHKESFIEWAASDLAQLEAHYKKAAGDIATAKKEVAAIEALSARLKSQAGTFNYDLGTLVAKSLNKFCNQHHNPKAEHLMVIRKHIDTLNVIFSQTITGNGGTVGKELLDNLSRLVEKFK